LERLLSASRDQPAAARFSFVRQIAAFTGLSTNTISRWKRGE